MDVVGVAVVGGADGNYGFERGRAQRGDLKRVEPAPGLAHHADGAIAPGLLAQPADDLNRVVQFLREIFVFQQAIGLAGAAHIDADGCVAVRGEIAVHRLVATTRAVALAVGDIFEDRRDRGRVVGQPEAGGEAGAVGERDEEVFDHAQVATPSLRAKRSNPSLRDRALTVL